MATIKANALAAVRDALAHTESFIAASRGDDSRCGSFNSLGTEAFTEAQRRAVRVYVESWIAEPLRAALASVDGERGYSNERYLDSIASPWH